MRGVIYKLRSEFKQEVIKILEDLCSKKWAHTYSSVKSLSGEDVPLNIYFLGWFQKTDEGIVTEFNFDEEVSLPQYTNENWEEERAKKAITVRFYLIDYDNVNNYVLLLGSRAVCNKLMRELNKIIFEKLKKNIAPFLYVSFSINNEKIDKMKQDKSISTLNLIYVDETDDTIVKSSKITSKKDMDLTQTDDYKRIGEMSDNHKTIKCHSLKFKKKITFNEEGYFSSNLSDVQFKAMVIFFIAEFEKVGVIKKDEFSDILVA